MFKCMHYKDTSSSEVKNQRAIVKRTSQIMKFGQDVIIKNGQMYNIQNRKGHYGAPDRVNILYSHRHIHTHINHTYIYVHIHACITLYHYIIIYNIYITLFSVTQLSRAALSAGKRIVHEAILLALVSRNIFIS